MFALAGERPATRAVRESLASKSSKEGQEPARERFMRGNAQDVEPGFLRCDLQSVRREVEQVIGLVTIPARPSRFPGADIGNSQMQQSPGPEPPACRIEKSHRVRDVLEQVIHHYDVEQVVTGKRLERPAIHVDAGGSADPPASRGGYVAPARAVSLRARGGE